MSETQVSKKYRVLTDASKDAWDRVSFWTKASDVENTAGSNLQTTVGAIKGITTSTSTTQTGYAADATTVATLAKNIGTDLTLAEWNALPEASKKNGTYYIKDYDTVPVTEEIEKINQNLNGFEFKVEDGVPMWKNESAGADTFAPFKGKPTLLWTNPNPNNSFDNQTIVFNKEAKSKVLLIEYKRDTTANPDLIYVNTIMWDTELKPIQYLESAGTSTTRRFNNPTSTSINCYQTTNNTTNIPLRIWEM